jgi:hypothetical protein
MPELAQETIANHCPVCGWSADTLALKIHENRCQKWRIANEELGHTVRPMQELDVVIDEVRQVLSGASTDVELQEASTGFVKGLFERSLGHAIKEGHWRDHPGYTDYAHMVEVDELGDAWRDRVEHRAGHIAPGFTFWEPEGSRERRVQFRAAERH